MVTNTTMLIKTNKDLKIKAQKLAKKMGLPLSTLVNNYLREFVVERKVTFEAPYVLNKKTQRIVDQARKEYKEGKFSGPFTAKEFIEHLKSL